MKLEGLPNSIKDKPIQLIDISNLLLDADNPRFGHLVTKRDTQREIVNIIVNQFGVDDVLSSISVSGYFSAEPIICRDNEDGTYTVVEGNRRLAAMAILANEERAVDHERRHQKYKELHDNHGNPEYNPVPCIVFSGEEEREQILSYLGVRHIVSTKQWDSYAKATWVSDALKNSHLELNDISKMIGDDRGTIQRLLLGFNFVDQLQNEGKFFPDNTMKKGRGSNTSFPFSWIYTILGHRSVKNFVGLSDDPESPNPIAEDKLENAALLVKSMFGNSGTGEPPAISDSRQLTDLADVVANKEKVAWLKSGKNVQEIQRLTKPLAEFIGDTLIDLLNNLRDINTRLEEEGISKDDAHDLTRLSNQIKTQSDKLNRLISESANE